MEIYYEYNFLALHITPLHLYGHRHGPRSTLLSISFIHMGVTEHLAYVCSYKLLILKFACIFSMYF